MPLLYFLEGAKTVTDDKIKELGLSSAINHVQARECFRGPGGPGGAVFSDRAADVAVKMDLDNQQWRECGGGLWVGFEPNNRPIPTDLERPRMIDGTMLELWDGNLWQIPVIREWRVDEEDPTGIVYATNLPRALTRTATGWVSGEVVPPYRHIAKRTADAFQYIFGSLPEGGTAQMSDGDAISFAVEVLALNYRVDANAVSALNLLDPGIAGSAVRIAIGAKSFEAAVVACVKPPETKAAHAINELPSN